MGLKKEAKGWPIRAWPTYVLAGPRRVMGQPARPHARMHGQRWNPAVGDGELFSTFRRDHRKLSRHLEGRADPIDHRLQNPNGLDFVKDDRLLVTELLAPLDDLKVLTVASCSKEPVTLISCYGRRRVRISMVVSLDGPAQLLDYWPDADPDVEIHAYDVPLQQSGTDVNPPRWRLLDSKLSYTFEYFAQGEEPHPPPVNEIFANEEARIRSIVRAVNDQTLAFLDDVTGRIATCVETRRAEHDAAHALYDTIALPPFSPPRLRIQVAEPSVDDLDSTVTTAMPPRVIVKDDDWTTFVGVLERWASTIERNPAAFSELDEYALRDLLLATLHTVYPVALGEVMTAGRKSDIFVIADTERPTLHPIIAELKIWTGKAGVQQCIKQHLEQLTVRETRGALMYFVKQNERTGPRNRLHAAIESAPGFERWTVPPGTTGWPVASIVATDDPNRTVEITVMDVFIDRTKIDRLRR